MSESSSETVTATLPGALKNPIWFLTLYVPETKIAAFANSVDIGVAYNEPTHLDLHCLPSNLWILNML